MSDDVSRRDQPYPPKEYIESVCSTNTFSNILCQSLLHRGSTKINRKKKGERIKKELNQELGALASTQEVSGHIFAKTYFMVSPLKVLASKSSLF